MAMFMGSISPLRSTKLLPHGLELLETSRIKNFAPQHRGLFCEEQILRKTWIKSGGTPRATGGNKEIVKRKKCVLN